MAPLVASRVNVSHPFEHVSLDYCGPFDVRRYSGRCNSHQKCYEAVFICQAIRAIHLEVVEELTASAFLDAYQLFAARRGHCRSITSDNATNFVGANNELRKVLADWRECSLDPAFETRGIEWKFIMPRSPSQGGSHESAVKIFKHHLRRMVGANSLSINEFRSLTTRIEACLNSRPLSAQTQDPLDPIALTPAHFLIGRDFENVAVDPIIHEGVEAFATRWRKLQRLHQYFWREWQNGYLNSLQCRNKWREAQQPLQVGDIVLIKEDNCPPQQWAIGRISETHPGADGLVRNVTIQRANKTSKRAVQKLIKLPVDPAPQAGPREDVAAATV